MQNNENVVHQNRAFLNQQPPQGNNLGVQLQGNNPDGQVVVHHVLDNQNHEAVQNHGRRQEVNPDGLHVINQAHNQNVLPLGANNAAGQHIVHEELVQHAQNQHQDVQNNENQAPNFQGGRQDQHQDVQIVQNNGNQAPNLQGDGQDENGQGL